MYAFWSSKLAEQVPDVEERQRLTEAYASKLADEQVEKLFSPLGDAQMENYTLALAFAKNDCQKTQKEMAGLDG